MHNVPQGRACSPAHPRMPWQPFRWRAVRAGKGAGLGVSESGQISGDAGEDGEWQGLHPHVGWSRARVLAGAGRWHRGVLLSAVDGENSCEPNETRARARQRAGGGYFRGRAARRAALAVEECRAAGRRFSDDEPGTEGRAGRRTQGSRVRAFAVAAADGIPDDGFRFLHAGVGHRRARVHRGGVGL